MGFFPMPPERRVREYLTGIGGQVTGTIWQIEIMSKRWDYAPVWLRSSTTDAKIALQILKNFEE